MGKCSDGVAGSVLPLPASPSGLGEDGVCWRCGLAWLEYTMLWWESFKTMSSFRLLEITLRAELAPVWPQPPSTPSCTRPFMGIEPTVPICRYLSASQEFYIRIFVRLKMVICRNWNWLWEKVGFSEFSDSNFLTEVIEIFKMSPFDFQNAKVGALFLLLSTFLFQNISYRNL